MGRPKLGEPAVSRERVLEAAAVLFRELGYEKTSVSALGKQLGVSAAALYYHFDSKEDILTSYLEQGLEEILARTQDAMTAPAPAERLVQLVRTYVLFDLGHLDGTSKYAPAAYGYYQLVQALPPPARKRLDKLQRSYLELLRSTIQAGVETGDFDPVDVTLAAFSIVGMASHAIYWFRPRGARSAVELSDTYADHALRIVGAAR